MHYMQKKNIYSILSNFNLLSSRNFGRGKVRKLGVKNTKQQKIISNVKNIN